MVHVSLKELVDFVKEEKLESKPVTTQAQQKEFTVRVVGDGLEYTPASSGAPRRQPHKVLSRVCEEFSRTNSFKPADYQSITRNASYALAVIAEYVQSRRRPT
jgi:hypothetical protein